MAVYIGTYKGFKYYPDKGVIHCHFGWIPKEFSSIRSFKLAVTKRINEQNMGMEKLPFPSECLCTCNVRKHAEDWLEQHKS
jgi:hypothetical protein